MGCAQALSFAEVGRHKPARVASLAIRSTPATRRSARRCAASPARTASRRGARPPSPRPKSGAWSRSAAPTSPAPATARCFLLGFAGALRRSELVGLDVAHVTPTAEGCDCYPAVENRQGRRRRRDRHPAGRSPATCPVAALDAWLAAAELKAGPLFRKVTRWGAVEPARLHPDAVRQSSAGGRPGGPQGHVVRAGHPARHARRFYHHGLQERRAGRRDHGPHAAPQPDDHAQLRPPGEAQVGRAQRAN